MKTKIISNTNLQFVEMEVFMKKNNNKIAGICFLAASICYFISAIIGFISNEKMAVTNLCLGACFLCLSLASFDKDKKNKD